MDLDSARRRLRKTGSRCSSDADYGPAYRPGFGRAEQEDLGERYEALAKARDPFVTEDRTGFVWVLYRR